MHTLQKIRLYRVLLCITYPIALVFIYPFAMLKKRNKGSLFFFFDRYVIGGAQRVHLDILMSVKDESKKIFFTRLSKNDKFRREFYDIPNAECADIHFWCDNLLFRLFSVHYYSFYINRHGQAHVFSSNSTFFYDMLFFLNKKVVKTELLHNYTYGKNGLEYFGFGNYKYLDFRLTVDKATFKNITTQYKENGIAEFYNKRVRTIEPGVYIPAYNEKSNKLPLKVLYAGRGSAQKRIYLLDKIAKHCIDKKLLVEFHFAGTMMDELSDYVKENSILHGQISKQEDMYALYKECHAIILTSSYEGFPMLIKESMASGCIPIVTALEGNLTHLTHLQNSLLMVHPENEAAVITEGIANIEMLIADSLLVKTISKKAYAHAQQNFDKVKYVATYSDFFNEVSTSF